MEKFKRIFIEISNVCNLSCSFCPPSAREKKLMTVDEFEEVLRKIEGHGDHVYLHVRGEPLCHPNFKEILEVCDRYHKKVNITTNGTLLDKHGESILSNPSVRLVNISLQSFENEENKKAYEAYLNKVLRVVKEGLCKTNILFELRLWNIEGRDLKVSQESQKTLDYIEKYLDCSIPVTDQKSKGLKGKSNVYISKGYEFQWPSLNNDIVSAKGTCYGLRRQIAILSTGEVVPCCLDAEGIISLGNILESDFQDIVSSNRATLIASGFENNKIIEPLCIRCSYRECFV